MKVCGITTPKDASLAVQLGANAIGVNFYPQSPRFVSYESAKKILRAIPPPVLKVAVCVRPSSAVTETCRSLGFDVLQVHGFDRPDELPATPLRIWVAVSPQGAADFPGWEIVVDESWGQGRTTDWQQVGALDRPLILSGGLHAENVREAVLRLRPAGVDVCSGVERTPGRKDPEKLERFLHEARRTLSSLQR